MEAVGLSFEKNQIRCGERNSVRNSACMDNQNSRQLPPPRPTSFWTFQGKCLLAQPLAPSENSSPGTRLLSATAVDRARGGRADGPQAAPRGRPWLAWPCEYRW